MKITYNLSMEGNLEKPQLSFDNGHSGEDDKVQTILKVPGREDIVFSPVDRSVLKNNLKSLAEAL